MVDRDSNIPAFQSAEVPGLGAISGGFFSTGRKGISAVASAAGDRVFARSAGPRPPTPPWNGFLHGVTYNNTSPGVFSSPFFQIAVTGADATFGVDQLAIHPDGTKLYVPEVGSPSGPSVLSALNVYDAGTGALLTSITDGALLNPTGVCLPGKAPVISNQPPVADAGIDETVECGSSAGTSVTLDGTFSSDPDSDPLTFTWTGPFREGSGTVTGDTPSVTLPLGLSTITLEVDDGNGGTDTDMVDITVEDSTPPTLSLTTTSIEVVPTTATGAVVDVPTESGASAMDACDSDPVISHDGPAEFPIGATTLVTITATDVAGNFSEKVFSVKVLTGDPGSIEQQLRDLAASVEIRDLSLFDAPNNNARKGRRNAISNKLNAAANAVASGDFQDAIDQLTSLLAKLDGAPNPPDWMVDSPEKVLLRSNVETLITSLETI